MTIAVSRPLPRLGMRGLLGRRVRNWTAISTVTFVGLVVASAYLMPLGYMAATSLKDASQMSEAGAPLFPAKPATFAWQGQEYIVYNVPTADGVHQWALVDPRREDATFVDPAHPEIGAIEWQGRWRTLEQAWQFDLHLENFVTVWNQINFGRLLFTTFAIAIIGTFGTLISSVAVAYGFSRFRFRARNALFLVLLSTIIYLQGNADAQPLSVGIAVFNALYSQKPTLIQAAAVMSIVVPVLMFFFAQRAFMRGIVITGVEK